jgi:hypothetical protein
MSLPDNLSPTARARLKRERHGVITILVALALTVLGLVGAEYYSDRFLPAPSKSKRPAPATEMPIGEVMST